MRPAGRLVGAPCRRPTALLLKLTRHGLGHGCHGTARRPGRRCRRPAGDALARRGVTQNQGQGRAGAGRPGRRRRRPASRRGGCRTASARRARAQPRAGTAARLQRARPPPPARPACPSRARGAARAALPDASARRHARSGPRGWTGSLHLLGALSFEPCLCTVREQSPQLAMPNGVFGATLHNPRGAATAPAPLPDSAGLLPAAAPRRGCGRARTACGDAWKSVACSSAGSCGHRPPRGSSGASCRLTCARGVALSRPRTPDNQPRLRTGGAWSGMHAGPAAAVAPPPRAPNMSSAACPRTRLRLQGLRANAALGTSRASPNACSSHALLLSKGASVLEAAPPYCLPYARGRAPRPAAARRRARRAAAAPPRARAAPAAAGWARPPRRASGGRGTLCPGPASAPRLHTPHRVHV